MRRTPIAFRAVSDLAAYEQGFRRAGLPAFIAERTAARDIWTRAVPLLSLVFLAELSGAVDLQLSFAVNALLVLAAVGILLATLMLVNRVRGRPALARPEDVEAPELVAFVLVPALLPLALNGQWVSALVTAAGNAALLGLLYAALDYGLVSIVLWAGRRLVSQLAAALTLLIRAIPLLLLFSVVLFINTEMWQAFALLDGLRLAGGVGLLAAVAVTFLLSRAPREVAALETDVREGVGGTPLDRRERVNVGLVLMVSQLLQVLVVSAAVGAFYVAFGLLVIPESLVETWTGEAPRVVLSLAGVTITQELFQVALAIAALSGLYYAIATLTDATYREEFLTELTDEMRASFVARAAYDRERGALDE